MPPQFPDRVLRRQWGIAVGSFFNGDLTFQWQDDDLHGALFNPAEGVAMGKPNGTNWVQTPATYNAGPPPHATVSLGGAYAIGNLGALTNVVERKEKPAGFALSQNYPNPFNPVTTIQFYVPRPSHVRLKVYNPAGTIVATLVDRKIAAGTFKINWDASRMASGFYLYRLEAEGFAQTKKLLLMK